MLKRLMIVVVLGVVFSITVAVTPKIDRSPTGWVEAGSFPVGPPL